MQGTFDAPALLVQEGAELWIDKGVHHHAGLGLHVAEHAAQLALGAHQGPQVLDRIHALELRRRRARYGDAGLAGCVRDQMQMKPSHEPATTLRAAPARARILNVPMWEIRGQHGAAHRLPAYPQLIRSRVSHDCHNGDNTLTANPARRSSTGSSFSHDSRGTLQRRLSKAYSCRARPRRGPGDNSPRPWDERHNPLLYANNNIHPY